MAVGQYEVRVDDAWIATAPDGNPEDEVRPGTQIWIRVNAQAGKAIMNDGAEYRLQARLLNLTANYTFMFAGVNQGNLHTPAWPDTELDKTFTFGPTIAPPDSILRVLTVLTSGAAERGVNVFEGDMCVVTP